MLADWSVSSCGREDPMPAVPPIDVEGVGIEVPLLAVGIPVHVHGADHARVFYIAHIEEVRSTIVQ